MGRSRLPTFYFFFRMEFTQHLDDYEHAKCVELPPEQRLSKNQIHKQTGVPYTTVCEHLSGRRGGGKREKIAGGRKTKSHEKRYKQVIKWVTVLKRGSYSLISL